MGKRTRSSVTHRCVFPGYRRRWSSTVARDDARYLFHTRLFESCVFQLIRSYPNPYYPFGLICFSKLSRWQQKKTQSLNKTFFFICFIFFLIPKMIKTATTMGESVINIKFLPQEFPDQRTRQHTRGTCVHKISFSILFGQYKI